MLVLHGAAWLTMKAEIGRVRDRARRFRDLCRARRLGLFALGLAFVAFGGLGFKMDGPFDMAGRLQSAAHAEHRRGRATGSPTTPPIPGC